MRPAITAGKPDVDGTTTPQFELETYPRQSLARATLVVLRHRK